MLKNTKKSPTGFKPTDALKNCLFVVVLGASFPPEILNNSISYTDLREVQN